MVVVRVNRLNRQSKIDMINVKPSTPTEQYKGIFLKTKTWVAHWLREVVNAKRTARGSGVGKTAKTQRLGSRKKPGAGWLPPSGKLGGDG